MVLLLPWDDVWSLDAFDFVLVDAVALVYEYRTCNFLDDCEESHNHVPWKRRTMRAAVAVMEQQNWMGAVGRPFHKNENDPLKRMAVEKLDSKNETRGYYFFLHLQTNDLDSKNTTCHDGKRTDVVAVEEEEDGSREHLYNSASCVAVSFACEGKNSMMPVHGH